MILVDTSVIVAWLDPTHPQHKQCWSALRAWAALDELAVSSVSFAELAAGPRTREAVDEDLKGFFRMDPDFPSAWRARQAFRRFRAGKSDRPVFARFLYPRSSGRSRHTTSKQMIADASVHGPMLSSYSPELSTIGRWF